MITKKKTVTKTSEYKVGHIKIKPISKKRFDAMTPAGKIIAICRDVIARLDAGKIVQKRGQYLRPSNPILSEKINSGRYSWSSEEYRDAAQKPGREFVNENLCEVCAKGALVLSWAANFNEVSVGDIYQRESIDPISDVFSYGMRNAMERAFETHRWSLRQIMQWIVEKKGHFHFNQAIYPPGDVGNDFDSENALMAPTHPPKRLPK